MNDSQPEFTSIAELAAHRGTSVPCAGNLPVNIDNPDCLWFIEHGSVNLFLIESEDGKERAPQYLLSREAGQLLPGVTPEEQENGADTSLRLIAKGSPGTLLKRLPTSSISEVHHAELAEQIDTWLLAITATLSRFTIPLPRPTALAELGAQVFAPCTLSVRRGVLWVSELPQGEILFMDIIDQAELHRESSPRESMMPLTPTSWITLFNETKLTVKSTETLAQQGVLWAELSFFHEIALAMERLNRKLALADDVNLERARITSRRMVEKSARQHLFNMYDQPTEQNIGVEDTTLLDALQVIGQHEGIEFKLPKRSRPSDSPASLDDILNASGVRARRVKIKADGNWWWGDSNALLAFRSEDGQPVALLPGNFGRYREIDPVSKRKVRVNAERASALEAEAWMFYQPLPSRSVNLVEIFRLAVHGSSVDLVRLVLAGLPYGLIRLLPAFALGFVANEVSEGRSIDELYILAFTVAGLGLLGGFLHMLQSTAMIRLEGRSASRIEAAFWDRLMRLPSSVLRRQPSGDLAMSGMTFQKLRDGFQGVVANSFLSIIFLLPIFWVIFFYDTTLGVVALVFSLISLLITVVLGLCQISPYGRMISAAHRVAGRLFQIVGGITKLRVESAEGSAFAIWARDYREQKRAEVGLGEIEGHSRAFGTALPFLAGGVLLFSVVAMGDRNIPISDFLIVYTVFLVFQSAIARLGESLGTIAATLPAFQHMRPLLAAVPETEAEGEPVEYLGGEILFDQVSFRYDSDGPLILDNVTIHIHPGEFVAIAGESGAGKSTLFRLALGIDRPTSGTVYYDGRELRHLNLKQLRRHIGTVPQSVGLHPQDLWDNLVGHHDDVKSEELWTAARTADVEDQIRKMPMGMMTMVGTSGAVLSGGETQRITIARSVIRNPRVMLFDEATNWLDNESQAKVMQNLTALTSTRLVIAHRLSTLEQADHIYVMQAGKIVQSGTFDELIAVDGVFRELVKRQTL